MAETDLHRHQRRRRLIRHKISRRTGLITIADKRTKVQFAKARHALSVYEQAKKDGREADAAKALARQSYHNKKGHKWLNRKRWLAGQLNYLEDADKKNSAWLKHYWETHQTDPSKAPAGTQIYDGRPVANWIAESNKKIRAGGISFTVISGYRTKEESRQLCRNMCGADTCPGRCAGIGTNHACPWTFTCKPFEGAEDIVGDIIGFENYCYQHGINLHNHLPFDRNHHSASGY